MLRWMDFRRGLTGAFSKNRPGRMETLGEALLRGVG